jgi:hypothetical protein
MAKMAKTRKQRTQKKMKETATPDTTDLLQTDAVSAAVASGETTAGDADLTPAPAREEIARPAYCYWEARGGDGGSPEDDWFRAQRELRAAK